MPKTLVLVCSPLAHQESYLINYIGHRSYTYTVVSLLVVATLLIININPTAIFNPFVTLLLISNTFKRFSFWSASLGFEHKFQPYYRLRSSIFKLVNLISATPCENCTASHIVSWVVHCSIFNITSCSATYELIKLLFLYLQSRVYGWGRGTRTLNITVMESNIRIELIVSFFKKSFMFFCVTIRT